MALSVRLARAQAEVDLVTKLITIANHEPEISKTAAERIFDLLHANWEWSFSPAEIREAVHVSEPAVRKALQHPPRMR